VSGIENITYALDFPARGPGNRKNKLSSSDSQGSNYERAGQAIPGSPGLWHLPFGLTDCCVPKSSGTMRNSPASAE
jgi:hypothetical protein